MDKRQEYRGRRERIQSSAKKPRTHKKILIQLFLSILLFLGAILPLQKPSYLKSLIKTALSYKIDLSETRNFLSKVLDFGTANSSQEKEESNNDQSIEKNPNL